MIYARRNIQQMAGYVWGEQPDDAEVCKLNTNESPYPPSPAVAAALNSFDCAALRTYPQPTADPLREALAEKHGLSKDHVLITHGGDEALRLAITTFVPPGGTLGCAEPSYSLYPVLARIQDAKVLPANYGKDWTPPADFAAQANAANATLTCLVNPHAPSGRLMAAQQCAALAAELDGVLLLDEAYVDFVDPGLDHHTEPLLARHDNLLVLRSFSKGYGLAGLRLGYLLGQPALIEPLLTKTRDSYNVDAISQALGLAAFRDQAYAQDIWRLVREERGRLRRELASRGLQSPPSQTNFLLATVPDDAGLGAGELQAALRQQGVLVRYFDMPMLHDKLRITVGANAQNSRLLAALDALLGGRRALGRTGCSSRNPCFPSET